MPRLSRWMIRLALLHLWIGFSLAALLLTRKDIPERVPPEMWRWLPAHINLLLVGWMVEFSMGVIYWIFPRLPFTRTERGRPIFAWVAAILLNGGIWLHVGAILISPWWENLPLQTSGLILQALGIAAFGLHVLPRIRPTLTPEKSS